MKSLSLIFALLFATFTTTLASENTVSPPSNSHNIDANFLGEMIETDAWAEQDACLFETQINKNFLQGIIDSDAAAEDQSYISDFRNMKLNPDFLLSIIEENTQKAK